MLFAYARISALRVASLVIEKVAASFGSTSPTWNSVPVSSAVRICRGVPVTVKLLSVSLPSVSR